MKYIFNNKVCDRCNGSGRHSFNLRFKDRCFKCYGKGCVLTDLGKDQKERFESLTSLKTGDLKAGNRINVGCGKRFIITIDKIIIKINGNGCPVVNAISKKGFEYYVGAADSLSRVYDESMWDDKYNQIISNAA